MFAQYAAPFIDTPLFALQSSYDAWSLSYILGRTADGKYTTNHEVNTWGVNATSWIKAMIATDKGHGAFLSSCSYHCVSQQPAAVSSRPAIQSSVRLLLATVSGLSAMA